MFFKEEIAKTLENLNEAKTILYPTDTVWGLGCDATNSRAVAKIYELKNRVASKSLIILVNNIEMLKNYVSIPNKVLEILENPTKPTTIIYQNPQLIAENVISKEDNTVAIRIVQDEFCKALIQKFGKPIVSTSANVSGDDTPKSFSEISKPILDGVDYIVDLHKERETTKSSTILKIVGEEIVVLRE